MKMKLLPLAIAAAAAVQTSAVLADATVYGKVNISAQQQTFEYLGNDVTLNNLGSGASPAVAGDKMQATNRDADQYVLNTNTSRLGVKGKNKINDDVDAVYKMEFEVVADTGEADASTNTSPFKSRNIVAGLSSKTWGTIQGGKNDTALKMLADGTDQFNDLTIGDINNYMFGENRQNNVIMYTSPVMGGVTLSFTDELSEDSSAGTSKSNKDESGFFARYSAAAKYNFNETSFIGLATDRNIKNADIVRLVGSATLGDFTVNAHIQSATVHNNDLDKDGIKGESGEGIGGSKGLENALARALGDASYDKTATGTAQTAIPAFYKDIKDQDAWMVNGKYQMGDWAFKAQYGQSSSDSVANNATDPLNRFNAKHTFDARQIALGVDYSLSKNTILYGYAAELTVDADEVNFVANNTGSNDDSKLQTVGVGFETKF